MPLSECMQAHTYKQYVAWMCWNEERRKEPTLDQWYMIQIASEVRTGNTGRSIKMEDLKLRTVMVPILPPENKAEISRKAWIGMGGEGMRIVRRKRKEPSNE